MSEDLVNSEKYNQYLMFEMGKTFASEPEKIIDLLEGNDYEVDDTATPIELVDFYLEELPYSDSLKLGTAYLVEKQNSSFSGEIDNENVFSSFDALSDYWDEDLEPTSNIGGLVGGIVSGGLGITNKIMEGQQKKKYGALDLAQKQADSRTALIQGVIAQKQAESLARQKQAELDAKKKRNTTIAVVSVIGIIAIVGTFVYIKKRNNG